MRPNRDEYDPYYEMYVSRIGEEDVLAVLARQAQQARAQLGGLTPSQAAQRYAPDKWSVEEVLGHVVDIEWVATNRVLRFARGDTTPLPDVDQDVLMHAVDFTGRLPMLLDQFEGLRQGNVILFNSLDGDALTRRGVASGRPVSVRALLYFIAGHTDHHLAVLRERYG